jgi:uncharacterized protein (DUF433 family)
MMLTAPFARWRASWGSASLIKQLVARLPNMTAAAPHGEFWRSRLQLPNYAVGDAARYAGISPSTVGRWQRDTTKANREARNALSYLELIEVAVVAACREAGMKLREIEAAHRFFAQHYGDHPFATLDLKTDGVDLAMDAGAELLIGNRGGQLAWKEVIGRKFKEFDYEDGLAYRWHVAGRDSRVIIDPRIQFGAPQIKGVPTWALKGRWQAGEAVSDISDDFGLTRSQVVEGLLFEGINAAAEQRAAWTH